MLAAAVTSAAAGAGAAGAGAAEFRPVSNERFGFSVDVPAGYTAEAAAGNDDGRSYKSPDGRATLAVYGHLFTGAAGMIEDERQQEQDGASDGLRVTYRQVSAGAATFSGLMGDRIVYQRAVTTCGGTAAAILRAEYPADRKTAFDPLIRRMAPSLRGSDHCRTARPRGWLKGPGGPA